jgi:hypothetical membrane protein
MRASFAASMAANLLFWPALVLFAALRPDYSHFTKAVSELGAFGAPNMWAWNLLGFMLPGVLLAFAGWDIGRRMAPEAILLPGLLMLGGLMMAFAGLFPADMADRAGLWTRLHLVGAFGSLAAWLLAIVLIAVRVRGPWRDAALVAMACVVALATAVLTSSPHSPALTQRLMFGAFFFSYPALALTGPRESQRGRAPSSAT